MKPGDRWDWPHLRVIREGTPDKAGHGGINGVLEGRTSLLMIITPPRHGKSYQLTEHAPAYILEEDPTFRLIQASYGATLAKTFSRRTRAIVQERIDLSRSASAVQDWETERGGGLRSAGVGNGITGRGGNGLIIDDPIKSRKEANSKVYRDSIWDAITNDFMTRLEPGGCGKFATQWIILILTRWHDDDPAGRFLRSEIGRKWAAEGRLEIVHLPALADPEVLDPDPLGRLPGEALCPDRYTAEQLHERRMMLGPRDFASLFQGVPMPAEGNLVMRRWLRHAKRRPEAGDILATVQSWDTAQKAGELNDWSVCTTWAVTRTNAHLIDQLRERYEYPALERAFRLHADQHNPSLILVEDKGHGTALIQNLRGQYPIVAVEPLADKMTRLSTQSTAYETGRIIHPDPEVAEWIIPFETELTSAPDVEHDDRCDSVSQFLAWYNRGLQNFRFKSVSVPSENTDVPGATDSLDPSTGFGRLRSGLDTDGF